MHPVMVESRVRSLRALPSVERLLASPAGRALTERFERAFVAGEIRAVLDRCRAAVREGRSDPPSPDALMAEVEARVVEGARLPFGPVVNATGIGLHTNLGRAVLAPAAVEALCLAAAEPLPLEYDLRSGGRAERDALVEDDLRTLAGAEAAAVVNNNAAAVLLALNTLAEGREVLVSRGELIEIGGSFRLPDVMRKSGAILREVGTTNRTHLGDYADAVGPQTALLLKVHTSNYRLQGFTASVSLAELVDLGRRHGLPVMEDLGSGALVDLGRFGLPREPVVAERVRAGADVVTFSGDKVLGGPQAGLLVGGAAVIERIRRNPLRRALRPDKLTLAGLAATLRLYRTAPDLSAVLPVLRWCARPLEEIETVGREAAERLAAALGAEYEVRLEDSVAFVGGGALPEEELPSKVLAVTHERMAPRAIAERFRSARPPILGRVQGDRFLLDLRGVWDPAVLVPSQPVEG